MTKRSVENTLNIDQAIGSLKKLHLGVPILERHFTSPYKTLISCIISLRTKDEVSDISSEKLFFRAKTPSEMIKLNASQIAELIYPAGFYKTKAENIIKISSILLEKYQGVVPDELDKLLVLPGVGLKTANLVLAQGFHIPAICVDTHVHRIMNRIGYVHTSCADDTEKALNQKLAKKHWLTINSLLVNFGREICKPVSPMCSRCPLTEFCPRIGVFKSR